MALGSFPQRIPVLMAQFDAASLACRADSIRVVATQNSDRLGGVGHHPGKGQGAVVGATVFVTHAFHALADANGSVVVWVKQAAAPEWGPGHRTETVFFALCQGAIIEGFPVQQAEFDLVGDEGLRDPVVEQIELCGMVVGDTRMQDFTVCDQSVETRCGIVGGGQPIGTVDEQDVEVVSVQQAQGFFGAADKVGRAGVVVGCSCGLFFLRWHVDTAFADDLKLIPETRFFPESGPDGGFHSIEAVDFRGVDGGDAEFEAEFEPGENFFGRGRRLAVEQAPGAENHFGDLGAFGRDGDLGDHGVWWTKLRLDAVFNRPYLQSKMTHDKMKISGLFLGLCGLLAGWAQGQEKPNIVFILADDMGWPDLSGYGHRFHETPVLDQLASEGIKFTDFYAATPVCSSTRSTIQTGQYSGRTGITDFIPGHWRPFEKLVVPEIDHHLKEGVRTPGNVLGDAGYVTGYFGKWHLGDDAAHQPNKHGYQITEHELGQAFKKGRGGIKPGPKKIDFLTDASLWFIEQNKDKPFFLTLSHHAVHIPLEANEATVDKYEKKGKPAGGVNNPRYAAMTEDLDTSVGRVLGKLKELGLEKNTIVVFASDNGGLEKIYTGVGELVSTNAPLRDEKGTLYEGGIRVPMIVRWPGVVKPGTVSHEPATTADLLPTFCEMTGAKLPSQSIDGSSLVNLLKDPGASLNREAIYFHYPHYHHSAPGGAIRAGDWKLIEFFDDGRLELYHLKDDIGEKDNLAAKHPERASGLQGQLAQWRKEVGASMPTVNPKADPKRAAEWWDRRKNEPLDVEAMRKRYESRVAR